MEDQERQEAESKNQGRGDRAVRFLAVAVAVQSVALLLLAAAVAWPLVSEYKMMQELSEEMSADWYGVTEEAAWELDSIFDKADADAYMALYRSDDQTVDRDAARKEFEATCAKLRDPVEVSVGLTKIFKDEATGETIARVGLELTAGDGPPERFVVYVLPDGPELALTGIKGRRLSQVEVLYGE